MGKYKAKFKFQHMYKAKFKFNRKYKANKATEDSQPK